MKEKAIIFALRMLIPEIKSARIYLSIIHEDQEWSMEDLEVLENIQHEVIALKMEVESIFENLEDHPK